MTSKQTESILNHLEVHGSITPLDALQLYGCFRLASRIWDLKAQGHDIRTENASSNGKTYAKYVLARKTAEQLEFV
jgi:hypothetical protein